MKLIKKNKNPIKPKRVVIFGANGFVGSSIANDLQFNGIKILKITKDKYDLLKEENIKKIRKLLKSDDSIIFISALAPCKNVEMLRQNIVILDNFCKIINNKKFNHLVNISSDAVFADSMKKINETSSKEPDSVHGIMHLTREKVLESNVDAEKLAHVRPTLIYGKNDSHNGYGPNLFARLIKAKKNITLFGKGEERRDHVLIDDVAKIVRHVILYKCYGSINAVSGNVISFYNVAKNLKKQTKSKNKIITTRRKIPMPHNGYRAFDNSLIKKLFNFKMIDPETGFKELFK